MLKNKISVALDSALPMLAMDAGHTVSFNDGLPTVDDGWAFYVSQLAHLESKIYEARYTNINYMEIIPVNTSVPEYVDNWDYISYDAVTMGKFIGSSADDLPKVGLQASKSSVPLGYAGISFDYSLDELRKSQQLRIPIDTSKGAMAARGAQEQMQKVAYFGDSSRGMTGLFNNPNVALDNSTTDWSTATGQEIIDDMNGLFIKVWVDSANVHVPNTLVLDSTRYATISSRRMDSGTDTTILEFFMANNLYTSLTGQRPRVVPRLQATAAELARNGISNGGKDRMVAYELNEDNLSLVNNIPFRALAPQTKGLNIQVPCEYKFSGTEVRYPFSMAYRDHV